MSKNKRGFVHVRDHVRHRKRLTRTGHTKQRLLAFARKHTFRERTDRLGLVARRLKLAVQHKLVHTLTSYAYLLTV